MIRKPLLRISWLIALLLCSGTSLRAFAEEQLKFASLTIEAVEEGELGVDQTQRLRVLGLKEDGRRFAYPGKVKWSVNGSAAFVSDNGFISGLGEGRVEVLVSSLNEPNLRSSLAIEVKKKPIQVYFQAPNNWNRANIWYWYLDGDAKPDGVNENGTRANAILTATQGNFPGPAMQPVPGRPGWFSFTLPRFDDETSYPGRNLKNQPLRLLFSDPVSGEKTRDFQHLDGCFRSYNRYISPQVIDGRWESPQDCPVFKKSFRVIAEPRGGPLWSEASPLTVEVQGSNQALTRVTLDGSLASAKNGANFPAAGQRLTLDEEFAAQDESSVCLYAEDPTVTSKPSTAECFAFQKQAPGAAQQIKQMGVSYSPSATTFTLWSPDRKSVELWIDGQTLPMGYIGNANKQAGVWAITVPGDLKLKRYSFIVDDVLVRDPYARMVEPGTDYCIVMDTKPIQPAGGWAPTPPLKQREDAVIYEMSVRDFTISPSSGVSEGKRGTFLGLVEAGTYLNKGRAGADAAIKTGIEHLKELGVTHVQLMPSYDYATCSAKDKENGPLCYNWGYDPENYNVPEERYSTKALDYEFRVQEFQTMVNELHKAGIRVIMDVVYNHTWVRPYRENDEGEQYLSDITSKYFLFDRDGFSAELTGTGNTIDPKDPMVKKYIQDSLEYWVQTYNIDGFRFDLAGAFDYTEITDWMTYLYDRFPEKQLLAYGEPYTALPDPDPKHFRLDQIKTMTRSSDGKRAEFGGFNYIFREAIKGSNDGGSGGGYAFNDAYDLTTVINGLRGSLGNGDVNQSAFSDDPGQSINYATSHDNLNLYDKINAWAAIQSSPVSLDYKKRIQVFTNAIVLLSQGIPFIHSGEEFLRVKGGLINTYKSPDSINQVDWTRKKEFKDVADAYAQLIQARRRFAGLRLPTQAAIENAVRIQALGNGLIEIKIAGDGRGREELLILLNSGLDRSYSLPVGDWNLVLGAGEVSAERKVSGAIRTLGTSATLLYR